MAVTQDTMAKPVDLLIYSFGFLSGNLFEDLFLKVLFTTLAMLVGTTISHYWKRYLIKKRNRKTK